MSRRRRVLFVVGAAIVVAAILSLLAPPDGGGVSALRRFLSASGIDVRSENAPPSGGRGTFVLLIDRRSPGQEASLLSWVATGGRLVVTDPGSPLFARFGVTDRRAGVFGTTVLPTGCVRPETLGVRSVEVAATDQLLSSSSPNASVCVVQGSAGYAVFVPRGDGEVVLIGGASFMGDSLLNHADDAVFAHNLLDAGGPVVFGPPSPIDTKPHSIWSLIPRSGKAVVLELAIATVLFAFARGRRVGRPVPEELVSPLPSGELVHATARLYRLAGARAFCAETLRGTMTERMARRLGLPPDPDHEQRTAAIERRIGDPDPSVPRILRGPDPASDQEFVALCRELERLANQIEGAER